MDTYNHPFIPNVGDHMSNPRWYYTDLNSTVMFCGRCYDDDQYCRITTTAHVRALPQTVVCAWCKWKPKCDVVALSAVKPVCAKNCEQEAE